ncbi:YbaB/EbfC family nucleoid-associated protein [Nocardia sp. NBC_01730]|uniref:YbaB/EbfC family nucleoid-associated protein n=1 Tax=Nocardia sp. NBC_01730 TaxID=2975998 RepID=UPI002E13F27A|nr:YbaB/EbfC family nucleoid-associated protein [Nocardia sp. NBC_01730]
MDAVSKARLADVVDAVRAGMDSIAVAQRRRAELTATGSAGGGRVSVSVNADGVVIDVRFGDDVGELSYGEIAAATLCAAQDAAARVREATVELLRGVQEDQARMPKISEFLPGMPDVLEMLPEAPEVSVAPLGSAARRGSGAAEGSTEFTDVQESGPGSGVTNSAW